MKKTLEVLVLVVIAYTLFCAQAKAQGIKGTVLDENGAPMEFATIAVLSLPDSTVVCGGMTDESGVFDLAYPEGTSLVRVSMIGYATVDLPLSAFAQVVTVNMRPDAEMLESASVSASLPRTEIKGDAVVTNIAGSVLEHTGNALDVLGKVPGMIATNGKLEVLGRGEPVYYLNGRKVTDNSELSNLMSEDIKSIEVISNPGALYSGEISCVVRIRTVKRQGDGFSFALTSQAKQHIYDCRDFEPSRSVLDLNYRKGGWDIFGKIVYWDSRGYQFSDLYGGTYINNVAHYQDGKIEYVGHNGGMQYTFGANWQINENHSIGFKLDHDVNSFGGGRTIFDADVLTDNVVTDHLQSISISDNPYNGQWLGNFYYDGNVGKLNINFNADFVTGMTTVNTNVHEDSRLSPADIATSSDSHTSMGAGKLVLSYPIGKGMLQTGAEETYVTSGQEYKTDMPVFPSSDATLTENTIAGFVQYSLRLPFGQLNAGLRYEHVDMSYDDHLVPANNLERHQDNWFPSLTLSAAAGPVNLSLSYTGKTVRPGYHMLSNEIQYDNRFIYQSGDPKLLNAKHRTLSLNANWKWLTFSSNYEKTYNSFVQWATPYNDEGVAMIRYANLGSPVRRLSFYLNASPSVGVWYPRYTVGMQKQFLRYTVEDPRAAGGKRDVSLNDPMYLVQANNAFRFKRSWEFEVNYQYISPMAQDIYKLLTAMHILELSVQKSFLKDDALTVRLTWTDALNGKIQHNYMDYGCYIYSQTNDYRQPGILLRVSYRFNSANSKYKGTGAGQDAKSRM